MRDAKLVSGSARSGGSVWRRWDLHVHTPDTVLADRFTGWGDYLDAIEAAPEVRVIGVTDYMSVANYAQLKSYQESGRLGEVDLLIPNVEFRVTPERDRDGPSTSTC